ncbi:hypothetical protein BpHYR1_041340 [Brachionus plicatilis]|uniref:Uncharacterized protein n=1 Tax=Brachionus plicatilis TaxID=10195 RepID=A0A3M7QX58_BRAPC|nr:hypothetical protein BpHYR1_041340 [Brachionus plicatilis]
MDDNSQNDKLLQKFNKSLIPQALSREKKIEKCQNNFVQIIYEAEVCTYFKLMHGDQGVMSPNCFRKIQHADKNFPTHWPYYYQNTNNIYYY